MDYQGIKPEKKDKIFCTVQNALDIVGGKWAFPIINALIAGKRRFKELERTIPGINTRMLVKELKLLEQHKLITREAFATVPPTVEYSLTEKGRKLEPVLLALNQWSIECL
ncbi:helix-turn-helix domain-containing protein [Dyadobacter sp. SG02]|uniref:winged helix-turn-helix transcriptional regulator n=1 Tax=Dyadobacter sp. SG02 TaxID=1855291 RepID=UPI001C4303D2|nr:helix-turn-helix domain-containing protein [Dyadobacter sp. SG02]